MILLEHRKLTQYLTRLCYLAALVLVGCGIIKESQEPPPPIAGVTTKPLPPEKTEELLGEVGSNWLYGEGLGSTALTVGTVALFPPFAVLVVGNAALNLSGYESVGVSSFLPEEDGEQWTEAYGSVAGAPGKVAASMAGREFRTKEVAKEKIERVLKDHEETSDNRTGD